MSKSKYRIIKDEDYYYVQQRTNFFWETIKYRYEVRPPVNGYYGPNDVKNYPYEFKSLKKAKKFIKKLKSNKEPKVVKYY